LEAGVEFRLQFFFGPEREWPLGTSLFDVLADQSDNRLQQPVAGRTAGRAVPILLDHDRGEPGHTPEILKHPFQHFRAVRDVGTPHYRRLAVQVDPGLFDLGQHLLPAASGPTLQFALTLANTQPAQRRALLGGEMLFAVRVLGATSLAGAFIHD
jgi:hypothetical protein